MLIDQLSLGTGGQRGESKRPLVCMALITRRPSPLIPHTLTQYWRDTLNWITKNNMLHCACPIGAYHNVCCLLRQSLCLSNVSTHKSTLHGQKYVDTCSSFITPENVFPLLQSPIVVSFTPLQQTLGIAHGDLRLVCGYSSMETHFMNLPMNRYCVDLASRGSLELGTECCK